MPSVVFVTEISQWCFPSSSVVFVDGKERGEKKKKVVEMHPLVLNWSVSNHFIKIFGGQGIGHIVSIQMD